MTYPIFFSNHRVLTIAEIASEAQATIMDGVDLSVQITRVGPLDLADQHSITFLENSKYALQLQQTKAAACFVIARFAKDVPVGCIALIVKDPLRCFAKIASLLYPTALRPQSAFGATGISSGAFVHPEARLGSGIIVDPGAIIGPGAEIGSGTLVGAHAVIGANVRIGHKCALGSHVTVQHCIIGNEVILHSGVCVGQDGFGFAMGAQGHLKIPQVGRVIIEDNVEIGANSTIDRGANRDTFIGEGTKIDNLVQIAHNVRIGRHCVIASQVGISGSTQLGDFVVLAGQVGLAGHLKVGSGAQLGGQAGLMRDVPAGARFLGTPARPYREFFRDFSWVEQKARESDSKDGTK